MGEDLIQAQKEAAAASTNENTHANANPNRYPTVKEKEAEHGESTASDAPLKGQGAQQSPKAKGLTSEQRDMPEMQLSH